MNSLFPPPDYRREVDQTLSVTLAEAEQRVFAGSVVPTFDVADFRSQLSQYDFQREQKLSDVLRWTIEQLEHGLVHVTHPRYFGLFNPTPSFPAQCADRIAASFNPQLATWTTSPAAVEIESHVIRLVAQRLGLTPEANGHFTTGGSEANYTALLLALTLANPDFTRLGARAFSGQPVFYVSRDSHLAWLKIAHQAGAGRDAPRLVATDGSGRLHLPTMEAMIASDRAAGCVPVLIAATAGTTNAGMIDPLEDCVRAARAHGLWCHVDAAWAGALIAADDLRVRLAGIEQADSVTIDAHKWFATTMGCGMFITQKPELLSNVFQASNTYMPSGIASVDPYITTIQWSRRFLGLRLFLTLATAGWGGCAEHVKHSLRLSDLLRRLLLDAGWTVPNNSPAGVVCAVPPDPASVRSVVARVLASGRAWVSVATFENREVIRACVTSGLTTDEDICSLVAALAHN